MDLEEVKERLKAHQRRLWAVHDSRPTEELVHYTSPSGFRGIIGSGELWLSDIRRQKDPRESLHALRVIQGVICRKSVANWFSKWVRGLSSLFGLGELWDAYVTCFCTAGEERYMWIDYACRGEGCAIIFDYTKLFEGCNGGKTYALFPILYDETEQRQKIGQNIDYAVALWRESGLPKSAEWPFWVQEISLVLLGSAARMKEAKWGPEQEFRMQINDAGQETPFVVEGVRRVKTAVPPGAIRRVIRGEIRRRPCGGPARASAT